MREEPHRQENPRRREANTDGAIHTGTVAADGRRASAGRPFPVGSPGGHAVRRSERKCDGEEPPAPLRGAPEGWCWGPRGPGLVARGAVMSALQDSHSKGAQAP